MIALEKKYLAEVKGILKRNIPEFEVWLFGSRACGNPKKYSDIDLLIRNEQPLGDRLSLLKTDFSDSDLPYTVDVVEWARLSEEMKKIVLTERETIQVAAK